MICWRVTDTSVDKRHGFDFMTGLFSQRSKGTVELKSKDPFNNPVIDPHYLEDPLDVLVLSEGMRLGNEIVVEGPGLGNVIKGPYPPGMSSIPPVCPELIIQNRNMILGRIEKTGMIS